MAIQLARAAANRLSEGGRQRGIEHGFAAVEPFPVQSAKPRRAECTRGVVKAFIGVLQTRPEKRD